ncbi:MAG: hypothetical protein Q7V63_07190 [Gammaproteobacteria bacterium]|nr:hypothetical protein [Gammaproteobacteria bacterium]
MPIEYLQNHTECQILIDDKWESVICTIDDKKVLVKISNDNLWEKLASSYTDILCKIKDSYIILLGGIPTNEVEKQLSFRSALINVPEKLSVRWRNETRPIDIDNINSFSFVVVAYDLVKKDMPLKFIFKNSQISILRQRCFLKIKFTFDKGRDTNLSDTYKLATDIIHFLSLVCRIVNPNPSQIILNESITWHLPKILPQGWLRKPIFESTNESIINITLNFLSKCGQKKFAYLDMFFWSYSEDAPQHPFLKFFLNAAILDASTTIKGIKKCKECQNTIYGTFRDKLTNLIGEIQNDYPIMYEELFKRFRELNNENLAALIIKYRNSIAHGQIYENKASLKKVEERFINIAWATNILVYISILKIFEIKETFLNNENLLWHFQETFIPYEPRIK